jgi:osmotically-inducible protein OsmY
MKSDNEIQKNVMDEIQWDPQLTKIATQIGVTVKDEVVTLSGNVDYYSQKLAAEKAAKRVKDVKVVAMDMVVKSPGFTEEYTDQNIAEAIRNAVRWHWAVNEDLVNIKVEGGWVYLVGEVDWEFERKAVQRAIEDLCGVKGVVNSIRIKPVSVEPSEIKKKIATAFLRHATVDSEDIHVAVVGHKVVLTGKVRSWTELKDAEDVAWAMSGVTEVENKLKIEHETFAGE